MCDSKCSTMLSAARSPGWRQLPVVGWTTSPPLRGVLCSKGRLRGWAKGGTALGAGGEWIGRGGVWLVCRTACRGDLRSISRRQVDW